jgi:hypothetical protein
MTMSRTMRRTSQFLGGAAITTAATALLLSTLSGTANAAVGAILVQQLNASLVPVCAQNYVVGTAPQTIHDATCAGAVYASFTGSTPLSVVGGL